MSLGITPSSSFEGMQATAECLKRGLGESTLGSLSTTTAPRRHADHHQSSSSASNELSGDGSPSRSKPLLPVRGRCLPPLLVDCGEASMRSRSAPPDGDAANHQASHQAAQRFTDEIVEMVASLERTLRQQCNKGVVFWGEAESGAIDMGNGSVGRRSTGGGRGKRSNSRLSLSSIEVGDVIERREQDQNETGGDEASQVPREMNDDDAETELCSFRPLGHDMESILGRKAAADMAQMVNASGVAQSALSPPWPDVYSSFEHSNNYPGRTAMVVDRSDPTTIEECLQCLDTVRKTALKAHRCVMDEVFEARQSVDDLQQRVAALTKTHDATVQRLLATSSKLQTTSTLLHQEKAALQCVLLKFSGKDHDSGGASSTSPVAANSTTPSGRDADDELDENELCGAPVDRGSSNTSPRFGVGSPASAEGGWSSVPDDYPDNPRMVALLMLPHEMANDVLRSRRQLRRYVRLISSLPAALQEHHDALERRFAEEWLRACEADVLSLNAEKERCYDCARLRLEGAL